MKDAIRQKLIALGATEDVLMFIVECFEERSTQGKQVERIRSIVCAHHALTRIELSQKSQRHELVKPRQRFMYFVRAYVTGNTSEIARLAGFKSHANVLHACRTVENEIETDKTYAAEMRALDNHISEQLESMLRACKMATQG